MKYCFLILLLFRCSFGIETIPALNSDQISCDPTAISIQLNEDDVNEDTIGYKRAIGAFLIKNYEDGQTPISDTCTFTSLSGDDKAPYKIEFDLTTPEGKACMSDLSFTDGFFGAKFLINIKSYSTKVILFNQDPVVVYQINCEMNDLYNSTGNVKPSKGLQNLSVDGQSGQFEIDSTIDGRNDFGDFLEAILSAQTSIEFNLKNVPTSYKLKAKNFWLSPSSDIDDTGAKLYVVQDWVTQSTDVLGGALTFAATDRQVKAEFETFFWTDPNSNIIYGHAEVCICDSDTSNCDEPQNVCTSSMRISKRSLGDNELVTYSSKPLIVRNTGNAADDNIINTVENETVAVMGAVFFMPTITLSIISIIMRTKKRIVVDHA